MADLKIAYAYGTITIAPQNIASSSNFTSGVESAVIDNTSNKYVDYLIGGRWTCGTTPTANTQVRAYVFAPRNNTPSYPDVMDGTSSAETISSEGTGRGFLRLGGTGDIDTTISDRAYDVGPFSVADLYGGTMPPRFGLYVAHNTGVNSNSTSGNHVWEYIAVYYTVV